MDISERIRRGCGLLKGLFNEWAKPKQKVLVEQEVDRRKCLMVFGLE